MQYTWNGGDRSYTDPTQWTPQGVPLYGDARDTVLIQAGTVTLSDAKPEDITIILSARNAAAAPNLVLDNAALGRAVALTLIPPIDPVTGNGPPAGFARITVEGYDTNESSITLGGQGVNSDFLTIAIAPYGQLNQEGSIGVYFGSSLTVTGTGDAPATLNNDALIAIDAASVTISADLTGSGLIDFLTTRSYDANLVLNGAVADTQHITFGANNFSTREYLSLSDPAAFHGVIDNFNNPNDILTLADTQATSAYFAQVTPDSGALLLLNGQEVVRALTVTGTHAPDAYGVSSTLIGSTTIQLAAVLPSS